ncbi:MAG: DUF1573 domain-containing protein [Bacteroidales bacterium]|nr:DUF1573 domain-containing protein [Bacteroidales bacterium]MBQ6667192.1 DUF1573 domain-containing protein [Bacteroidales bacterium]MBR4340286.1 DUF1573 domain-containing protein [Bacteroidales bacterium]MBR4491966.1 DUF1573 domain-containing protein [Bacteroidales bacterium]MBR6919068.1 DUF1573 domain-containing protein [Bacteroidales bacterium]
MKRLSVLLVAAAFIFAACSGNRQPEVTSDLINNPATPEGVDENAPLPAFSFDEIEHDFGTLKEGEKVSYSYSFINTGKANLIISAVVPGCGCTVADYTKEPVKPGKRGKITITFNSKDKSGQQRKRVSVQANTYPAETVLWFTANVEKP